VPYVLKMRACTFRSWWSQQFQLVLSEEIRQLTSHPLFLSGYRQERWTLCVRPTRRRLPWPSMVLSA